LSFSSEKEKGLALSAKNAITLSRGKFIKTNQNPYECFIDGKKMYRV
jgi:hypothetical protein